MNPLQYMFLGQALVGMVHGHTGLGNLLLVVSLCNIALVLTVSKNPSALAKIIKLGHNIYLFGGRLNILLGFGLMMMGAYSPANITGYWWIILSVLSWGGVEVVSKRMIKEDLEGVLEGLPPSQKMVLGFVLELIILIVIFACMHMRT